VNEYVARYELMISVEPMNVEPCIYHGMYRGVCDGVVRTNPLAHV